MDQMVVLAVALVGMEVQVLMVELLFQGKVSMGVEAGPVTAVVVVVVLAVLGQDQKLDLTLVVPVVTVQQLIQHG
jgi:hypothetical protein